MKEKCAETATSTFCGFPVTDITDPIFADVATAIRYGTGGISVGRL